MTQLQRNVGRYLDVVVSDLQSGVRNTFTLETMGDVIRNNLFVPRMDQYDIPRHSIATIYTDILLGGLIGHLTSGDVGTGMILGSAYAGLALIGGRAIRKYARSVTERANTPSS